MNRAFVTVAFVGTLALGSHVSADFAPVTNDCDEIRYWLQQNVDFCFDLAGAMESAQEQEAQFRECEERVRVGNQIIQWCSNNISSCPVDPLGGGRWVFWRFNGAFDWEIRCKEWG
jgi:hypothetical protein